MRGFVHTYVHTSTNIQELSKFTVTPQIGLVVHPANKVHSRETDLRKRL
jgi:hypothetical protein